MTSTPPALATVALVTEGDAESPDKSFSGTAHSLLTHLRRLGHPVHAIDAEVYGARRVATALRGYSRDRAVWRTRFRLGGAAFAARSRRAAAGVRALPTRPDVVLQIGATCDPPTPGGQPYVLYCDWNMRLAERFRDSGQSPAQHMTAAEARAVDEREARIYAGASAIFTISRRLRESFIADYGVDADRVVVAYAGPNMDLARVPAQPPRAASHRPTVLFVGKEFARKGGDVLLAAFARVRERVPDARLLVVGPSSIGGAPPAGVEVLGPLRKDAPDEWARLTGAFASADAFCLPTRYEPLGIVVIEAMYFGVACVTSDTWAMPEMVADGETGFVVPVNDAEAVADRLTRLLVDPALAERMGRAGRARAAERFSWAASAETISARVTALLGRPAVR